MKKKTTKPKLKSKNKPKLKKTKNKLPNGVSEEEFLVVLDNISKRLGHKFKFGYHSYEDMKQQAAIFALEGLEKYDNTRPLENFLWTHVRNRLFNYKRDNYQRPDKPCLTCPLYDPHCKVSSSQCSEFSDKSECEEYSSWSNRNNTKKNIMKPIGMEEVKDASASISFENNILAHIADKQIIDLLDKHIPAQHRETYLKLKYGDKVYKADLNKLCAVIADILKEHNYDPENS